MSVRRVMPHVFPAAPAETRDFYVDAFGFEVAGGTLLNVLTHKAG